MRPIDADALRQDWLENGLNEYVYDTNMVLDSIDDAPTLDYKDLVPQGKWENLDGEVYRCTNCYHAPIVNIDDKFVLSKFCHNCGARMINN